LYRVGTGRFTTVVYEQGSMPNDAVTAPAPPEVAQAAQRHDFGPLAASRAMANPWLSFVIGLVVSAACFGLLTLISYLGHDSNGFVYAIARFFGLIFCFSGVFALVWAIRVVVMGSRSYFAYANGFVYKHNSNVRAIAWPEVASLQSVLGTKGSNAGKLLQYNLQPQDNSKPIPIPLDIKNGRDPFLDQVIAALGRFGRPVQ
jgi:hypothetical protein